MLVGASGGLIGSTRFQAWADADVHVVHVVLLLGWGTTRVRVMRRQRKKWLISPSMALKQTGPQTSLFRASRASLASDAHIGPRTSKTTGKVKSGGGPSTSRELWTIVSSRSSTWESIGVASAAQGSWAGQGAKDGRRARSEGVGVVGGRDAGAHERRELGAWALRRKDMLPSRRRAEVKRGQASTEEVGIVLRHGRRDQRGVGGSRVSGVPWGVLEPRSFSGAAKSGRACSDAAPLDLGTAPRASGRNGACRKLSLLRL